MTSRVVHTRVRDTTLQACIDAMKAKHLDDGKLPLATIVSRCLDAFAAYAIQSGGIPSRTQAEAEALIEARVARLGGVPYQEGGAGPGMLDLLEGDAPQEDPAEEEALEHLRAHIREKVHNIVEPDITLQTPPEQFELARAVEAPPPWTVTPMIGWLELREHLKEEICDQVQDRGPLFIIAFCLAYTDTQDPSKVWNIAEANFVALSGFEREAEEWATRNGWLTPVDKA